MRGNPHMDTGPRRHRRKRESGRGGEIRSDGHLQRTQRPTRFPKAETSPGERISNQTTFEQRDENQLAERMENLEVSHRRKQDRLHATFRRLPPHHRSTPPQPSQPSHPTQNGTRPAQRGPSSNEEDRLPRLSPLQKWNPRNHPPFPPRVPALRGRKATPPSEVKTRLILDPLPTRDAQRLLCYVGNTQRLTTTFGEVRPNNTFEIKEKEIKERPRRQRDHDSDDE